VACERANIPTFTNRNQLHVEKTGGTPEGPNLLRPKECDAAFRSPSSAVETGGCGPGLAGAAAALGMLTHCHSSVVRRPHWAMPAAARRRQLYPRHL